MQLSTEKEVTYHPRKPFLAAFLSIVLPGMGQIYNGNLQRGLSCFLFLIMLPFLFGWSGLLTYFGGAVGLAAMGVIIRIYVVIDAFMDAKKKNRYIRKRYNSILNISLIAISFLGIYILYNYQTATGFRTFGILSVANMPTLHESDKVMVDFNYYHDRAPSAGDLAAFESQDQVVTIFRVIGQPGDIIDIRNGKISVNNKDAVYTFVKNDTDQEQPVEELEERLPNGSTHHIFRYLNLPPTKPQHYTVPRNKYFLLGENRDNAADSRYTGFVPKEQIRGKALYVFWSNDLSRLGTNLR